MDTMSAATQALGETGERVAARWLRRRGWEIVAWRYRTGHRDIDLVAEREGVVAFVEVKTRRRERFGGPVGGVGWRKQRELVRSATVWLDRHGKAGVAYRFDVIGVIIDAGGVRLRHVQDAFSVTRHA